MKKPIDSYTTFDWNPKTKEAGYFKYTKFDDGSIMGEPITELEYFRERGW